MPAHSNQGKQVQGYRLNRQKRVAALRCVQDEMTRMGPIPVAGGSIRNDGLPGYVQIGG